MTRKVRVDVEKRNKMKDMTLAMLEEGVPKKVIANEVGTSYKNIYIFRSELIEEGRTTKERIDNAVKARREKNNIHKKQKTLEGLRQGISLRKMSKELKIDTWTIKRKLIEEGLITEEEIIEAKKRNKEQKKEEKKKNSENIDVEEVTGKLLELLLLGIAHRKIKNIFEFDSTDIINEATQNLVDRGMITREKIKEAREEREKQSRRIVSTLIERGYTYKDIATKIPYADEEYISGVVERMKRDGIITTEEIKQKRIDANKKDPQKRRIIILEGLREGNSYREICEIAQRQNIFLTKKIIINIKVKLLKEGAITEEEIKAAKREKRLIRNQEKEKVKEEFKQYDKRIKNLITFRFSAKEISKILDVGNRYLFKRKKALIEMGELAEGAKFGNIEERDKWEKETREKLYNMISFRKDADTDVIMQYFEYAKEKHELNDGKYSYRDIKLLSKAIMLDESLITPENVRIIISRFDTKSKI